jgi:hypothetical protein
MKKFFLTTALLLGLTAGAFAEWYPNGSGFLFFNLFDPKPEEENKQEEGLFENAEVNAFFWEDAFDFSNSTRFNPGGGMLGRGRNMYTGVGNGFRTTPMFGLPGSHGLTGDSNAPVGSGLVVLTALGAAYLVGKRRKDDDA